MQGFNAGKKKHHVEAAKGSIAPKSFDICLPSNQRTDGRTAITLTPSLLDQRKVDQSLPSIWGDTVLMPGMVLLKGWLSIDDQVLHFHLSTFIVKLQFFSYKKYEHTKGL